MVLVLSGCAGAARSPGATSCDLADRFPIRPCASATQPSRVGVWQDTTSSYALVFDGCYVSFEYTGAREHAPDADLRSLAGGALVVEWRELGDPPPYFRAHARWQGDLLLSTSIIGERPVARWDGTAMRGLWSGAGPLRRVSTVSALRRQARRLLCVDRVVPTEAELARERGIPWSGESDPYPPTPFERMLREDEERRERELEHEGERTRASRTDAGLAMADGGVR